MTLTGRQVGITEQKPQMLMLSLPSAFQTTLVAPLHCSRPLSRRQNPYGQFLWAAPVYVFVPPIPSSCCKLFQSWQAREMLLGPLWPPVFLLPSSPLQKLLFFPLLAPSDFPLALVAPLFWTSFFLSSCQSPYDDLQRDLRAWLLQGWFSNKSGVHVV